MEYRSSTLANEVRDVLKLQVGRDKFPSILPVIDVNPKHARIANVVRSVTKNTSGTSNIYLTPSDRDFYITSCQFSLQTDATNDGTSATLKIQQDGTSTSRDLIVFLKLAGTATSMQESTSFSTPIKVDRNSQITINHTYSAGTGAIAGSISGYIVDNSNA